MTAPLMRVVRRHALVPVVRQALQRTGALETGSGAPARIVVAVSGGADSTALTLIVAAIASQRRRGAPAVIPHVAHVHHHLRGKDADDDAHFVRRLASRLALPFEQIDVFPADAPGNLAAAARGARYAALSRAAGRLGAALVLTAHHADDQFETLLLALARGSGLAGLGGMAPIRVLEGDILLLRPLLQARRKELEGICRAAGVRWRRDPTNARLDAPRVFLRRRITPLLEAMFPDAPRRAALGAEEFALASRLLDESARALDDRASAQAGASRRAWRRAPLAQAPPPVCERCLMLGAQSLGEKAGDRLTRVHFVRAQALIADASSTSAELHWPGPLTLRIDATRIEISRSSRAHRRRAAAPRES